MPEPVELWIAWLWTCPDCGIDHFVRSVESQFPPEQARDFALREGIIEDWQDTPEGINDGKWVSKPEQVKCPACSIEFPVLFEEGGDE